MKTADIINGFCELVFRDRKGNKIYPNVFVEKWEADLLEVTRSRLTYEYEVKVSRCDFHKDSKKQDQNGNSKFDNILAGGRTNYFYYIVPDGLVKPEEVPEFAGLIYAINGTRRWGERDYRSDRQKRMRKKLGKTLRTRLKREVKVMIKKEMED